MFEVVNYKLGILLFCYEVIVFRDEDNFCNREKLNLILEIVEGDKKSDIRHAAVNERKNRNHK